MARRRRRQDDAGRESGDRRSHRRGRVGGARPTSMRPSRRRGRRSTGPWGKMSARERGRLVWKLGERLMEQVDEVARLETLHNGKPITESRHIEIPMAAECLQYFAGWADKIHGETMPVKGNAFVYTLREPLGVVAAIVPWNFPLLLAVWKVAPALATGNTVILKPASQTPLTALALGELALEVGFPPGVLNVITGSGGAVGQAHRRASRHRQDRVHRRHVDRARASCAAPAETLKHITLELGGKSPNIVFRRRRSRRRRARRDRRHLLRQGRGLRRRIAAARRQVDQGPVPRARSPSARRRWCPAIRSIRRRGSARSRRRRSSSAC